VVHEDTPSFSCIALSTRCKFRLVFIVLYVQCLLPVWIQSCIYTRRSSVNCSLKKSTEIENTSGPEQQVEGKKLDNCSNIGSSSQFCYVGKTRWVGYFTISVFHKDQSVNWPAEWTPVLSFTSRRQLLLVIDLKIVSCAILPFCSSFLFTTPRLEHLH